MRLVTVDILIRLSYLVPGSDQHVHDSLRRLDGLEQLHPGMRYLQSTRLRLFSNPFIEHPCLGVHVRFQQLGPRPAVLHSNHPDLHLRGALLGLYLGEHQQRQWTAAMQEQH